MKIDADAIGALFDGTFASFDVVMIGGFQEPEYLPHGHPVLADVKRAEVRYTRDYPASALHEAAHWCLAGVERRRRVDYGYEYIAPPRMACAKARFFDLEERVQAIESLFAEAVGMRFQASLDDLTASSCDLEVFSTRIRAMRARFIARGLPPRAERFRCALRRLGAEQGDRGCVPIPLAGLRVYG